MMGHRMRALGLSSAVQGEGANAWAFRKLVVADEMVDGLSQKWGMQLQRLGKLSGAELAGCQYRHPLFDRSSPVLIGGDYITTESGTGLVHTAPGHGQEDYQVNQPKHTVLLGLVLGWCCMMVLWPFVHPSCPGFGGTQLWPSCQCAYVKLRHAVPNLLTFVCRLGCATVFPSWLLWTMLACSRRRLGSSKVSHNSVPSIQDHKQVLYCTTVTLYPGRVTRGKLVHAGLAVLDEGTAAVIEALRKQGVLLKEEKYPHKYPYDWRTRLPTIFRATDQASLRGSPGTRSILPLHASPVLEVRGLGLRRFSKHHARASSYTKGLMSKVLTGTGLMAWREGVQRGCVWPAQWFVSVEGFRQAALDAIHSVQWLPASGQKRITSMVEGRSDWCISRQRSWGVPLPVLYYIDTGVASLGPLHPCVHADTYVGYLS